MQRFLAIGGPRSGRQAHLSCWEGLVKTQPLAMLAAIILAFAFLVGAADAGPYSGPGAAAGTPTHPGKEPGVRRDYDEQTGQLSFLGVDRGVALRLPTGRDSIRGAQARAGAFLDVYGREFGLADPSREMKLVASESEAGEHPSTRYQQVYQGVPVMAGELVVNANPDGSLQSINGEVSPGLDLSTKPTVTSQQARETAIGAVAKWYGLAAADLTATHPGLWVFDERLLLPSARPPELVWRVEIRAGEADPIRELVLVNAQTGGISLHFNQIDTSWTGGLERPVLQDTDTSTPTSTDTETPTPTATDTPPASDTPTATDTSTATATDTETGTATETATWEESPTASPTSTDTETPSATPTATETPTAVMGAGGTTWYVATTGNNANDCLDPSTPCATINGAIGKATAGDTIRVSTGTYSGQEHQVTKDLTISGGWDSSFVLQAGMTTVDGQNARRGFLVLNGITAVVDRFVVQNGIGGGIVNQGVLTLNRSSVRSNFSAASGGGISSNGVLTLNESAVTGNLARYGGGLDVTGTATLNNSTVSGNQLTDSLADGGGIRSIRANLVLNSATVTGNSATLGAGIFHSDGIAQMRNSVVAANIGGLAPDCPWNMSSLGYNLLGGTTGCGYVVGPGDLTIADPELGPLIAAPGYHPLSPDSPAVDAGNPGGCVGSTGPLATDQRGAARVGRCDIGAYEYTLSGTAAAILVHAGTSQLTPPLSAFGEPLQSVVLDAVGSPVGGEEVAYAAPASGASGTFADSGTNVTVATTDAFGVASPATFTANGVGGAYIVEATVPGVSAPAEFALENGGWYVAPGGSNGNSCLEPASPCATINGVLGKAGFVGGDPVLVAIGTFTGSGGEVVLVDKSVRLLGGWDSGFTGQTGMSVIDGGNARRGIRISSGVTAVIERFIIEDGFSSGSSGAGIWNMGSLTLSQSSVRSNQAPSSGVIASGGGILSSGVLTLNNSTVSENSAGFGAGLSVSGIVTLNNTTVSGNQATAGIGGGGIRSSSATLVLNSSTVAENSGSPGGGIHQIGGSTQIRNTIVAKNTGGSSPDCSGNVTSLDFNLVGDTTGCGFAPTTGDLTNVDPELGPMIGSPGYHPLSPDSTAVDAGNPDGCLGSSGPLSTDQRGAPRVGRCDIGAYEFTTPGSAAGIVPMIGTPQRTAPSTAFAVPFQAAVLDAIGSPVAGVDVAFTAPASGASGTFADSGANATQATTDAFGLATPATFIANALDGAYTVEATVAGIAIPAEYELENAGWYVAEGGSDANGCQQAGSPCATINGVLGKAGFVAGDTVLVAGGTYMGSGGQVVSINKNVRLIGGWNPGFTEQTGTTRIDGQTARRGLSLSSGVEAVIERMVITHGSASGGFGGAIENSGSLTIRQGIIEKSTASQGGGISNAAWLVLEQSTVRENYASGEGGGIVNWGAGSVALDASTVSGNSTGWRGSGIVNHGWLQVSSSTVALNFAPSGGAIFRAGGTVQLRNTILAGNRGAASSDCIGSISSLGYNLVGDSTGCGFAATTGDLMNEDPLLGPPVGRFGYHPLSPESPAVDAGDPAGCMGSSGILTTDQRGAFRVGPCDIGAYEYTVPGSAASISALMLTTETLITDLGKDDKKKRQVEHSVR